MKPSKETLDAIAKEIIRYDVMGAYQAVIASKEVRELVEAAEAALLGAVFKHPDTGRNLAKALAPFTEEK